MPNFWKKLKRPILALAPMAGITDSAYRTICKRYGADVTYSEMASVSALYFKPQKTLELIRSTPEESPYVVQLFGKDPKHFAKATQIISALPRLADSPLLAKDNSSGLSAETPRYSTRRPDGIDINFGCPAKKVFGHGSGCALMPQKELAREIILAVCENTDLPVSIKIRAGVRQEDKNLVTLPLTLPHSNSGIDALEFIKNTCDLPYSVVMVHGRTYEGGFSGSVDFELVEEIKKIIPDKIVLANGGIYTPEDGAKVLRDYPLIDGLGIARGAWGRPWIFQEIKKILSMSPSPVYGRRCPVPQNGTGADEGQLDNISYSFETIKKIILEHAELIYKDKGHSGLFEIRKHMSWYVKGFPGASELRRKLVMANSSEEIKKILSEPQIIT